MDWGVILSDKSDIERQISYDINTVKILKRKVQMNLFTNQIESQM